MTFTWSNVWPHLLLLPIYQILGTIRHELSHAIVAVFYGWRVTVISVIPHKRDGKWFFGYCQWTGDGMPSVHILLAPYHTGLLSLVFGGWLSWRLYGEFPVFWWLVLLINLVVSPVLDLTYNLLKWRLWNRGDFASAFPGDQS